MAEKVNTTNADSDFPPKPLPLRGSGPYEFRSTVCLVCFVLTAVASVCIALFSEFGGGVEPLAGITFVYIFAVVSEQTWSLQWPHGDIGVLGIAVGGLAVMLAPTMVGELVGVWDIRVVSIGIAATTYWYMVRGSTYKLGKGSLSGKVCLITGCNTGIGLTTAQTLAKAGARVIFACRNEARAKDAMAKIVKASHGAVQEDQLMFIAPLDLGSTKSVKNFATKFRLLASMRGLELHYLVLNAGAMFRGRQVSEDGVEMTFASNHLGHFLLTNLLLPQLRSVEKQFDMPRIVIVNSSHSYKYNAYDFTEAVSTKKDTAERQAFMEKPYEMFHAYGQTKLAQLLFATELVRRLRESGSKMPVCVVHPGSVHTEIARDIPPCIFKLYQLVQPLIYPMLKTVEQGCTNTVWAVTSTTLPKATDEFYFVDRLAIRRPNEAGLDAAAAQRLWTLSEKIVGGFTT